MTETFNKTIFSSVQASFLHSELTHLQIQIIHKLIFMFLRTEFNIKFHFLVTQTRKEYVVKVGTQRKLHWAVNSLSVLFSRLLTGRTIYGQDASSVSMFSNRDNDQSHCSR